MNWILVHPEEGAVPHLALNLDHVISIGQTSQMRTVVELDDGGLITLKDDWVVVCSAIEERFGEFARTAKSKSES